MRFFSRKINKHLNFWFGSFIIAANFLAWTNMLWDTPEPYTVAPIQDQEVASLLEYIRSGKHSGEDWEITLTNLEAEQTITWYLHRYPQIPFKHPHVEILSDYIVGEGDAIIAGLKIHVGGKVKITLANGLPQVKIIELSLPLPKPLKQAIEKEIETQLQRADQLPVRFSSAEWKEGTVTVKGIIR